MSFQVSTSDDDLYVTRGTAYSENSKCNDQSRKRHHEVSQENSNIRTDNNLKPTSAGEDAEVLRTDKDRQLSYRANHRRCASANEYVAVIIVVVNDVIMVIIDVIIIIVIITAQE